MLRCFIVAFLAFTFVANAQCAASCLSFTSDDQVIHDCCKPKKTPDTKQCLNRTKAPTDAIVKTKSNPERPCQEAVPAAVVTIGYLPQGANPNRSLDLHHPPLAHAPSLTILRI
jgi:hypothetical protein